jgi:hypothetical protein
VAEHAGLATILGILSSLVVLILNGWLADRKSRREQEAANRAVEAADRRDARALEVRKLESNERVKALEGKVVELTNAAQFELLAREREARSLVRAKAEADEVATRRDVAVEQLAAKIESPAIPGTTPGGGQNL